MNKYSGTKYAHIEDERIKRFWEHGLTSHYKNNFDNIIWYEDGHIKDVEEKIDLSVVLLSVGNIDYQIKTKESKYVEHNIFLTIATFNNYAMNNYDVDKLAFGLLREGYIIICDYNDFIDFWIENGKHLQDTLGGASGYITFPLRLLKEYDLAFEYVKVRDSDY